MCNEGVGFSVCAGAWLGGKKPVLIMENSGLRVAAEYIARISLGGRIAPFLGKVWVLVAKIVRRKTFEHLGIVRL